MYHKMYREWTILLLLLCVGLNTVLGEIRLVCPPPQDVSANNTDGKCRVGNDYTPLTHGLFTVHIEEPIVRPGSPLRIRIFDKENPNEECILLDYIPHNDALLRRRIPRECKVDSLPLGRCNTSSYITIQVPDIRCDRCVLKVSQIVTNGRTCSKWAELNNDCEVYHSCANIKIRVISNHNKTNENRPSYPQSSKSTKDCQGAYKKNILPLWKYRSTTVAYEPKFSPNVLFNQVAFKFIDDGRSISFDIHFPPGYNVYNIKVYRRPTARAYMAVFGPAVAGRITGKIPPRKLRNFRSAFGIGGPIIKIQYNGVLIAATGQLILGDLYQPMRADYTEDGWIMGDRVTGVNATYYHVVTPHGFCAPTNGQFVSVLRKTSGELTGMLAYRTTNRRSHLATILAHPRLLNWNIEYSSTSVEGNIPGYIVKENVVQATLNLDPFTSVRVVESSGERNMSGDVFEAVQAYLWKKDKLEALATIRLQGEATVIFEYLLSNYGYRKPSPRAVNFKGPADEKLLVAFTFPNNMDFSFGGWPIEKNFTVDKAAFVLAYWTGHLALESKGPNLDQRFYYFGKFSQPSHEWCTGMQHVLCNVLWLVSNINSHQSSRRSLAALVATNNPPSVSISVLLRDVSAGNSVEHVYLYGEHGNMVSFSSNFIKFTEEIDAIFMEETSMSLSEDGVYDLASGRMWMVVVMADRERLTARVPPPAYVTGGSFPTPTTNEPTTTFNVTTNGTSTITSSHLPFVVGLVAITTLVI